MAGDAQERINELLLRRTPEDAEPFSHFEAEDSRRGSELADELTSIAAERDLNAAIDRAYEVAERSPGVAKYALKLFATHDKEAARDVTIPAPEVTESTPLPPVESEAEGKGGELET
ncbi:MAG TPA: hypothetical protein VFC52_05060 [Solirubrobacterales bacterium]|nr:hypothetical protein [Solirubrobacterales bacterium]